MCTQTFSVKLPDDSVVKYLFMNKSKIGGQNTIELIYWFILINNYMDMCCLITWSIVFKQSN